jgi:lysophospholipid acyltransferase (LPLAT)-like uncharacterized protein/ABC-type thiamine transport system ATPase subunit
VRGGEIRFAGIGFSYDGTKRALGGADLVVPAGKTVALVGPSGAGKSTILNLIPRFYDVGAGRITIDGQDVRAVTVASLRGAIALVSQEITLFDDTVRANIGYGRFGAGEAESSRQRRRPPPPSSSPLPPGTRYAGRRAWHQTVGRQRQRRIARAMLKNAPILLLGEGTSALDPSPSARFSSRSRLMQGRTTLVIAHRLDHRRCDLIYVIDQGRRRDRQPCGFSRWAASTRLYALQFAEQARAARKCQTDRGTGAGLRMKEIGRGIVRSDALRRPLCRVIALYIRFVFATSRWTIEGAEQAARFHRDKRPFILAFWHGRLLMMPMAWPRDVPIHMLISGHRDGRIIADAVGHFGITSIAGSSSRGGLAALRAMVKQLKKGDCVGITPDGPRGPAMRASQGIVAAARLARVPIIPLAYATRRRHVMSTWDRFHLAFPFTEGLHLWGEPIEVPADADDAALERYRQRVEDRLNALGNRGRSRMGHADLSFHFPPSPPSREGRGEGAE